MAKVVAGLLASLGQEVEAYLVDGARRLGRWLLLTLALSVCRRTGKEARRGVLLGGGRRGRRVFVLVVR